MYLCHICGLTPGWLRRHYIQLGRSNVQIHQLFTIHIGRIKIEQELNLEEDHNYLVEIFLNIQFLFHYMVQSLYV